MKRQVENQIAGALFDFCGFLTTLTEEQSISVGEKHEVPLLLEKLTIFAKDRGVLLDSPDPQWMC